MSKLLKAWSLAYGRAFVVVLIATAIVLPLGCLFIFVPLWLVTRADLSIWILIVSASLYVLILNGGVFGTLVWILRRRKRRLDEAFTPLGMEGERYMLTGRQYHGTVEGRDVDVRFYRGPMLELHLSTPLQTRFGVAEVGSTTPALARLFGREPLDLDDPALSGLRVYALDEGWSHSLLADPEAQRLVRQLLSAGESWALVRQVVLGPGAFRLRLYHSQRLFGFEITPEEAQRWLDDLLALTRIAERLPGPTVTAEESAGERLARSGGASRIGLVIVALVVGIPTCILAVAAAIFFAWSIR
ncbi:MAG: hypothetical protein KGY78_05410 [Anaerolineae bacterium]|nr:hypothetical protein [Anaerolineae bacterium]